MNKAPYDYHELQQRFLTKGLPYRYDVQFIKQYFTEKYDAQTLDISLFSELTEDPFFQHERATHIYAILSTDGPVDHSNVMTRAAAVELGLVSYVIFQSQAGLVDCDYFSVHGGSECLLHDVRIMNGIAVSQATLEQREFQLYLESLAEMGHI